MYSISTQAIVGGNLKFLVIAKGYPGSIHDARILRNSGLYIHRCVAKGGWGEGGVLPHAQLK